MLYFSRMPIWAPMFAAVLLLQSGAAPRPPAAAPSLLSSGHSVTSVLLPGHSRRFRVTATGPFRVELDQTIADFALTILDAGDRPLREVDAFGWGRETATYTGATPAAFIAVRRADSEKFPASFTLNLVPLSRVSSAEDLRIKAEDAGTAARALAHESNPAELPATVSAAQVAADLWKDTGDKSAWLRSQLALADALNSSVGALDRAQTVYAAALDLSRELSDIRSEAECLNNRGVLLRRQASYKEALDDLGLALELWRKLPVQTGFAATLNNLALLESDLGEYQSALGHYSEARGLLGRLGNDMGRAFVESNLGLIQGRLGDTAASIRSFESAALFLESHGNGLAAGRALTNSARMYLRASMPARAESNVRRGLALIAAAHDDRATAEGLNLLAEVYAAAKRLDEAKTCSLRALDLARQTADRVAQGNALMNLGLESLAGSDLSSGAAYLEEAQELFAGIGTPASQAGALYHLALAYRDAGDLSRAQEKAEAAVATAERLRGTVAVESLRVSFLASTRDYYFTLVDILARRNKMLEAWQVADTARARTLLESVSGGPPSAEERDIVRQLNVDSLKLSRNPPDAEVVRKHVERLAAELSGLRDAHAGIGQLPVPDLDQLRGKLGADTALIEYALGDSESYAWVLTGNSFRSLRLPGGATIGSDAARVMSLLNTGQSTPVRDAAFRRAAAALARDLMISDLVADLHVRRLAIVPDGPLDLIPFEVLPVPGAAALIDRYEVIEWPSVSVALALGRRREARSPASARAVALVGDPVFDSGDTRLGSHVMPSHVPPPFSRLAFSRREAKGIANLRPPDRVAVFLDFDASRELFASGRLADYGTIHISTHGVDRPGDTTRSGLVFSLVNRDASPREGMLSIADVANLRLSADIVVLSACNTAAGLRLAGEGSLSLARGFLYAGADRVIATRFQIDDESAAALLTSFYSYLWQDGLSPSAALRQAQMSLRRDPRWRSPFYWASFVLQGEP